MEKRGNQYWQLILLILAVVALVIGMIIIGFANKEVSSFTEWLGWVS